MMAIIEIKGISILFLNIPAIHSTVFLCNPTSRKRHVVWTIMRSSMLKLFWVLHCWCQSNCFIVVLGHIKNKSAFCDHQSFAQCGGHNWDIQLDYILQIHSPNIAAWYCLDATDNIRETEGSDWLSLHLNLFLLKVFQNVYWHSKIMGAIFTSVHDLGWMLVQASVIQKYSMDFCRKLQCGYSSNKRMHHTPCPEC